MVVGREMAPQRAASITDSMIAPIVTWKPWNPVSMKNVEP